MKIACTGAKERFEELQLKLSGSHELSWFKIKELPSDFDLVIDLNFDEDPSGLEMYSSLTNKVVIVSAAKRSLAQQLANWNKPIQCTLIGLNALPTFINRSLWEVSVYNSADESVVQSCMQGLGIEYKLVKDRVGMVTPRVVYMIINEAFYTVQEGTASMADIDIAMKLGTNYPMGPFEWCKKTGIKNVYEILSAIYEDTHDDRYKICPMLKTAYLKNALEF
jgi:3-hydroxybutyryl-CoA dehydrogenase